MRQLDPNLSAGPAISQLEYLERTKGNRGKSIIQKGCSKSTEYCTHWTKDS